jgi:hypothetical protein
MDITKKKDKKSKKVKGETNYDDKFKFDTNELKEKERDMITNKNKNFKSSKGKTTYEEKNELELKETNDEINNDDDSDKKSEFSDYSDNSENYNEFKNNKVKDNKRNLGLIVQELLDSKKQTLPFKKEKKILIKEEEHRLLMEKKRAKQKQRKLGYISDLTKHWGDRNNKNEKYLIKTATRGVVKLFSSVYSIKKDILDEQKKEKVEAEKKSKNFLMMHDLIAPNVSKTYEEDE